MTTPLTFVTAVVLGVVHAVDADHAVAVSAFVGTKPSINHAVRFGLRWAVGHSATVLVAGGALLALGVRWPASVDLWAERSVGVMLIAVGLWAVVSVRRLHFHGPPSHGDHAHIHLHADGIGPHEHGHAPADRRHHHHPRAAVLAGVLHGLAGTTGVLALVPVGLSDSRTAGLVYLLSFSLGVVIGMTLFASVVAIALTRAADRSVEWGRRIAGGFALGSVGLGILWLARAG